MLMLSRRFVLFDWPSYGFVYQSDIYHYCRMDMTYEGVLDLLADLHILAIQLLELLVCFFRALVGFYESAYLGL